MRTFIGGLLLTLIILPRWSKINWGKNCFRYLLSALLNTFLFFGLQTVGLVYLPGGLFAVLVYLQPVLISIIAWIWLKESMSNLKTIGLIFGFLGVIMVSYEGLSGELSIIGIMLALSTSLVWAIGTIYVKMTSDQVDFLWMIALQTTLGGFFLINIGFLTEDFSSIDWNQDYLLSLSYGATLGIPIAFILYFYLMISDDSSKIASYTFLVPFISVLFGTIFLNEPFTTYLFIGLIFIVLSIAFVNHSSSPQPS